MPGNAIRVQGVSKRFGGHAAVDNVSLGVAERQFLCIIGPNGAGKTTLFNLISGQLAPTEGRIFLGEQEITHLPAHRRAHLGVGRSFQLDNIFPQLSVLQNVRLAAQAVRRAGISLLPRRGEEAGLDVAARQALERVGLIDRAHLPAAVLPHGEKRKLDLAMVLAQEPRVILLDEPTAGISREEVPQVVDILAGLKAERSRTIILVEHKMDVILHLADEILVLAQGQVLDHGPPGAIMANPRVQAAYLGEEVA